MSEEALQATIVPSLKSTSLISLGKLCDDGCEVKLNSKTLQATKNNKIVVTGIRNHQDGLWDIPVWKEKLQDNHFVAPKAHGGMYAMKVNRRRWIPPPKPPDSPVKTTSSNKWMHDFDELIEDNKWDTSIKYQMREDRRECLNVIIQKDKTKKELAQYLHASLFSPTMHTLVQAIKRNHLTSWPGLAQALIERHLPESEATILGHIKEEQKGLQPTKPTSDPTGQPKKVPQPSPTSPIRSNTRMACRPRFFSSTSREQCENRRNIFCNS